MNHQNEIMIKKETTDKNGLNTMSDHDNTKNGLGEKWPEPTVRVQSLAESNLATVPDRYIKPPSERPDQTIIINHQPKIAAINIPVVDLNSLFSGNEDEKERISEACREFGFFQVKNDLWCLDSVRFRYRFSFWFTGFSSSDAFDWTWFYNFWLLGWILYININNH